jgi:hypothetical protein
VEDVSNLLAELARQKKEKKEARETQKHKHRHKRQLIIDAHTRIYLAPKDKTLPCSKTHT